MAAYYEFEVSLAYIQPRIWRRILLPRVATFAALHQAIQDSFGWQNCHLFDFRHPGEGGDVIAGIPNDFGWGDPHPDARQIKLNTWFGGKTAHERCSYVYDYGDNWLHTVECLGSRSKPETFKRRLLAGEGMGPPEDCGGPPGFERIMHFVRTGEDLYGDDPEDLRDWLGGWRPDGFDLTRWTAVVDR